MSTKSIDARLARIEAAQAAAQAGDPVADWLASFRRGDPVEVRNAWRRAGLVRGGCQRERLAIETLVTYEQDDD